MGTGKTLQALACAMMYEGEWPLLVVCPAALKYVWVEEIKKWLKEVIKKEYIQVVDKYGTVLDYSVLKIAIYSYEIASKSIATLQKFKVVIVD
jgi:SNF2 family DNA or RNA helicase